MEGLGIVYYQPSIPWRSISELNETLGRLVNSSYSADGRVAMHPSRKLCSRNFAEA